MSDLANHPKEASAPRAATRPFNQAPTQFASVAVVASPDSGPPRTGGNTIAAAVNAVSITLRVPSGLEAVVTGLDSDGATLLVLELIGQANVTQVGR